MKLSEIKGDRALEVIADIMEPISNIVSDKEAKKAFQNAEKEPIVKVLPQLIKTHKQDIYKMLAIIDGVSVDEYKKSSNMMKLLQDFSDIITDESVQSLFISAKATEAEK